MGLSEAATEKLLIIADKISNQKYMSAIKNAFSTLMPVIITGAFCTLVTNVICSTTTDGISLAKVSGFAWLEVLSPIFNAANYATLNFFTIGAVVLIGLELGKKNGINTFAPAVIALCSYVACCPTTIDFTLESGDVIGKTAAEESRCFHIDGHGTSFLQIFLEFLVMLPNAAVGSVYGTCPIVASMVTNG